MAKGEPFQRGPWVLIGIGVLCWAVLAPVIYLMWTGWVPTNVGALVGFLFPAVGTWFGWSGVRDLLDHRKWGEVTVTIDPDPAPLGGELVGVITVERALPASAEGEVAVCCLHAHDTGVGRTRARTVDVLWSRAGPLQVIRTPAPGQLSFAFALPEGLPPTSPGNDDTHRWVVQVRVHADGIDLVRSLPVEVTAESTPAARVRRAVHYTDDATHHDPIDRSVAKVDVTAAGLDAELPPRRRLANAIGMVLLGGLFLAGATLIGGAVAGLLGWFAAPLAVGFGTLGTGLIVFGLYQIGHGVSFQIQPSGVSVTHRWMGLEVHTTTVPLIDVVGVSMQVTGTVSDVGALKPLWAIAVVLDDGPKVVLADDAGTTRQAQALAHLVKRQLHAVGCAVEVAER